VVLAQTGGERRHQGDRDGHQPHPTSTRPRRVPRRTTARGSKPASGGGPGAGRAGPAGGPSPAQGWSRSESKIVTGADPADQHAMTMVARQPDHPTPGLTARPHRATSGTAGNDGTHRVDQIGATPPDVASCGPCSAAARVPTWSTGRPARRGQRRPVRQGWFTATIAAVVSHRSSRRTATQGLVAAAAMCVTEDRWALGVRSTPGPSHLSTLTGRETRSRQPARPTSPTFSSHPRAVATSPSRGARADAGVGPFWLTRRRVWFRRRCAVRSGCPGRGGRDRRGPGRTPGAGGW